MGRTSNAWLTCEIMQGTVESRAHNTMDEESGRHKCLPREHPGLGHGLARSFRLGKTSLRRVHLIDRFPWQGLIRIVSNRFALVRQCRASFGLIVPGQSALWDFDLLRPSTIQLCNSTPSFSPWT